MHTGAQKKAWKERWQIYNRVDLHRDGKETETEEDLSKWTLVLSVVL